MTLSTRRSGAAAPSPAGRAGNAATATDPMGVRAALRAWPVRFVLFAFACQVALLFLGGTALRTPLRVAVYAASLSLLAAIRPRYAAHPALRVAIWVPAVLALGLMHPERNTLLAAAGQAALYVAILAPLAWVAGGRPSFGVFRAVVLLVWAINAAGAAVGVLQVYYPGQFRGAVSVVIQGDANYQRGAARVVLADGTETDKPMGLSDAPGGAAAAGLTAIVLGIGLLLAERPRWLRAAAVGGMAVGLFSILLSQVRSSLIMAMICSGVALLMLAWRAEWGRAARLGVVLAAVAVGGGLWAFAVAGEQTVGRFRTLVADDPAAVFQRNRGHFLTSMLREDLWRYPFGAGLGRWGMMNVYFGDRSDALWSEMQWTSWLYDGGVLLVLLNVAVLAVGGWTAWKIATRRRKSGLAGRPTPVVSLGVWGAVVVAYDVAALAGSFNSPIFSVQAGLEVWLLNALLFSASRDPAVLAAVGPPRGGVERPATRPHRGSTGRPGGPPRPSPPRPGWGRTA